jgi:hypothetical protein
MKSSLKINKKKWTLIGFLLCVIFSAYGWFYTASTEPTTSPSLSEVVLFGIRPVKELDISHYRKDGLQCVKTYLDAVSPESYIKLQNIPLNPDNVVDVRRTNLEEQIVILFGENIRKEAQAFSSAVPLMAEWEGINEGPVDEANFTEQWLIRYPDTPIASFLYLFMAHRLRAGYETARAGHEKGLRPILAGRYKEAIDKALSSDNPLIPCIAKDMEAQSHVYLYGQGRP